MLDLFAAEVPVGDPGIKSESDLNLDEVPDMRTDRVPATELLQGSQSIGHGQVVVEFAPNSEEDFYTRISGAAKTLANASISSKKGEVVSPEQARTAAQVLESVFSPYSPSLMSTQCNLYYFSLLLYFSSLELLSNANSSIIADG